MNERDIENLKMIAIFITAFVSFANFVLNLHEKFLRKPKLIFQIESAKIIEDYLGEIGMQVNVSFRTRNGNLSLKEIDVKNSNRKLNKVSEIEFEIKEYIGEDIVKKYLHLQRQNTTIKQREEKKLDQFMYYMQLGAGTIDFRKDDNTGNPISPVITSDFQNSLCTLCREPVRDLDRYREKSRKVESIRDIKVEENISLSFTFFIHIYGQIDGDNYKRKPLPLDGWEMIVRHSEGELKRIIKADKIP